MAVPWQNGRADFMVDNIDETLVFNRSEWHHVIHVADLID